MSLQPDFPPVTVQAEYEALTVTTYRSILGGQHSVCVTSSDGGTHYLSPVQAAAFARAVEQASMAARDAEQAEGASRG